MHEDDDAVSALPVEELRRRVYAQGADEADERWIRAAAELTRRERASRPAAGDAAGSTPAAAASPDGTTLLGPDSTSDQRSRPVGAIFDGPQEDGDRPPKAVRADVDATTIRAVQTSVGLYAGLSVSGDLCLLVFPSGGAGVVSCASPDRVASDGLRIAWTTEFPSRNRDGSTGMITGDVTATWSGDDLITLTTPDRILAY
ncbi:hypothetical protein CMMCAS08_00420 [Clavibacter michiganensis subsp. michiganensis]|uniref:hypothetical protein n=1 Tax=Clavibacter michiganensis TaxID=28447 RepID=UPI000B676AC0|nr:hypothetical protein [Clavibacter michiganensis]OUE10603.1 hypothetical protein CMMCAS08_00420 [Clavibacter michiganensis subsp. michiganensis]